MKASKPQLCSRIQIGETTAIFAITQLGISISKNLITYMADAKYAPDIRDVNDDQQLDSGISSAVKCSNAKGLFSS